MKKDSGKKIAKSKAAPSRPPAKTEDPKAAPSSKPTPTTTPFNPAAASPLSKEKSDLLPPKLPPQPTSSTSSTLSEPNPNQPRSKSAAPNPQPVKAKPGKRPARGAERRNEVKVPSLLLEGDLTPSPPVSGPGARYALAPQPVAPPLLPAAGELPEAYGTGRVFLAARDPHWLYVSWDLTTEQQNRHNARSRDGHLIVKIFARDESTPAVPEVHVHPESKNWFVNVPRAETLYRAEIGYYDAKKNWHSVALSQQTLTPPDAPSTDVSVKFATIPVEVSFQQVVEAVQQFVTVSKSGPLLDAVAQAAEAEREHRPTPITSRNEPPLPRTSVTPIGHVPDLRRTSKRRGPPRDPLPVEITPGGEWSEDQTRALTKLIHIDSFRRVWLGSMEITELVRLQLQEEMSSIAAAEAKRAIRGEKVPAGPLELNISSPSGGEFRRPGKFWFKINAELIIYGATEPDATVTIADRPIKLRPDGTFSFRFSLPDGRYQLPAVAISSNREGGREARLEFSRSTDYRGHVEPHPQDAALRPPHSENVS